MCLGDSKQFHVKVLIVLTSLYKQLYVIENFSKQARITKLKEEQATVNDTTEPEQPF